MLGRNGPVIKAVESVMSLWWERFVPLTPAWGLGTLDSSFSGLGAAFPHVPPYFNH